MKIRTIALLGFGEVGQTLADDLMRFDGRTVKAYDPKFQDRTSGAARAARRIEVARCRTPDEAAHDSDLIISAVTAAHTVVAAKAIAPALKPGAWVMDLNSASPEAKRNAALVVETAGGRYIEVAVMSPIEPKRQSSPMLLGGPHARTFEPLAHGLGFAGAAFYSEALGKAAATKLCRSVMIKGLEALISESLLSARFYGVEDVVLESLNNLFPHADWPGYARYMISRTLEHGVRRAEEMAEAARTVSQAGITPWMSDAIVQRQAWAPQHAKALRSQHLKPMLDAMREPFDRKDAAE